MADRPFREIVGYLAERYRRTAEEHERAVANPNPCSELYAGPERVANYFFQLESCVGPAKEMLR